MIQQKVSVDGRLGSRPDIRLNKSYQAVNLYFLPFYQGSHFTFEDDVVASRAAFASIDFIALLLVRINRVTPPLVESNVGSHEEASCRSQTDIELASYHRDVTVNRCTIALCHPRMMRKS